MKKVVIALLVIAIVAVGAVSLVGCEKSLDGMYRDIEAPAYTLVIAGDKISTYFAGKLDEEFTFTRDGDLLTTTSADEWWKKITVTKDGNLTYPDKLVNGTEVTTMYTKVKAK